MEPVTKAKKSSRQPPIEQIMLPFQRFAQREASSGILLILCTVAALIWANSPWGDTYDHLWHTEITIGFGSIALSNSLLHWINDGLMVIFFFVVGLEIKREMLVGELSSPRQAALPIGAAIGGMVFPAAIYFSLNAGKPGAPGWGIPMATDIAFALGILSLLGKRVPLSLKVFLTAVAIVDDLGAVLVIALFYTSELSMPSLAVAAVFLLMLIGVNRAGIRHPLVYALLGIALWMAFLKSGVHATISGVLLAMTIPARTRINAEEFLTRGRILLFLFERAGASGKDILTNKKQRAAIHTLEISCHQVQTPLQRFEHALHPWVTYAIMPLFALANAGVALSADLSTALVHSVSLGVMGGLVLGKQLGITLAAWLLIQMKLATKPAGVTWRHIYGVSWLGGIGFTMSIFVANLAFGVGPLLPIAKVGIFAASLVAGVLGWIILRVGKTESLAVE